MKHGHYHKDVSHLQSVDVYRVIELFGVNDPCIQHAVKKLLCAGQRGSKGFGKDILEAVDTLNRCLEMQVENESKDLPVEQLTKNDSSGWIEHNGKGFPHEHVGRSVMLRRHSGVESGPHVASISWTRHGNDFWWSDAKGVHSVAAYRFT